MEKHADAPTSPDTHAEFLARVARNRPVPADAAAAYGQTIAIAVADELALREAVAEQIKLEQQQATTAKWEADQAAQQATYDAKHPIEAAYDQVRDTRGDRWSMLFSQRKPQLTLAWAIEQGILPAGTTEMPDTEAQYLALAQPRIVLPNQRD